MTDTQLISYLRDRLRGYGYTDLISTSDYIIAKGKLPICLIAHVDTVFSSPPVVIYQKNYVMWSPQGLGADDRAGVYLILRILDDGYRPHVIFTNGEEKYCVGARQLIADYPTSPFSCKYLIQLDRRGSKECVFYGCKNTRFKKYIKSFDFKQVEGTCTDISFIAPAWGVAAVNLAVGYYDEHTKEEYLNLNQLQATYARLLKLLEHGGTAEYFEYERKKIYGKREYSQA